MPKFESQPPGIVGWTFLAGFIALFIWMFWSSPILLLFVPPIAIYVYLDNKKQKEHYQIQLAKREGKSICEFARYFDCRNIDTWVVRAVYEQLENYMSNDKEAFPILPKDDIFDDLRIDDEDFDLDIVEEIAQRTGRSLENVEANPYYGKVNVVENLVYFFNEQPVNNAT